MISITTCDRLKISAPHRYTGPDENIDTVCTLPLSNKQDRNIHTIPQQCVDSSFRQCSIFCEFMLQVG